MFIARYRALEAFIVSLPPLPSFMASATPSPPSHPDTHDPLAPHSSSQSAIPRHLASSFVLAHCLARASIVRSHAELADLTRDIEDSWMGSQEFRDALLERVWAVLRKYLLPLFCAFGSGYVCVS